MSIDLKRCLKADLFGWDGSAVGVKMAKSGVKQGVQETVQNGARCQIQTGDFDITNIALDPLS